MPDITLTNIGPMARTTIPIPPTGGVTVLRGRNGAGKSIALDAIAATLSGNGKPPLKDLATRGEVCAFGATLTVGKSIRRRGELEVALLEGRISIADLVDPQIIDPARADAARIRALISLSGAAFSADDFTGFPALALDGIDLAGDPLTVIAAVRNRLNQLAVASEKCAASEQASARALRDSVGDADPVASFPDPDELNARLEAAIRHEAALQQAAQDAEARQARAESAKAVLSSMESANPLQVNERLQSAQQRLKIRFEERKKLEDQLEIALEMEAVATSDVREWSQRLEAASKQAALADQLQAQITAASPGPSPVDLESAQGAVDLARIMIDTAAAARRAADTLAKADAHEAEAETHAAEAVAARRWAKYTDELLSEQVATVAGCPLTVADGRLVTNTRRGPTYYAELSAGERWRMAMDIAIAAVGDRGLIVIPQEAWEGLDTANRGAIHSQAQSAGVTVLTAECSDDETVTPAQYEIAA